MPHYPRQIHCSHWVLGRSTGDWGWLGRGSIRNTLLAGTIPGWQPEPDTLNTLTQAALAYLDPGEGHPEPTQDTPWALAEAAPLRDCLRRWFDSLEAVASQEVA